MAAPPSCGEPSAVIGAGAGPALRASTEAQGPRRHYGEQVPWPRVVADLTAPLAAGAVAAGVAGVLVGDVPAAEVAWFAGAVLLSAPALVLGAVIARRQPRNPVGALLALVGLVVCGVGAADVWMVAAIGRGGQVPALDVLVSATQGEWVWLFVPVALLVLVFPDGRLPSRRWRPVAVALPTVALAFTVLAATAPAPYLEPYADAPHALGTLPSWSNPLVYALLPVLMGLLVASAASLRVRSRRAGDVGRAQLKWFALAGASIPATLLLCWASYLLLGGPDLVVVGLVLIYLSVPAATAVAMLRHDLYDVDRAVSAAATYTLVTLSVLGVYTVASFVGGVALGRGSPIVAAAATAVSAAALNPVRSRLQRGVDRRLYPVRQSALAAIDDLRARAHAGEARPEQLGHVLRSALGDPQLRVGYRLPGTAALLDADGDPLAPDDRSTTPVRLGEHEIGVLLLGRPCPHALARDVADASALLVEVVRLRLELGAALKEVGASRARLLQAGYAERRRLERDLHDGAQQRLVSLGMSLRLAQRHLYDGSVDVHGLLDQTVAGLGSAVAELRHLAHGLRPGSLDDGLGPALAHLSSTVPIAVDLDVRANGLPDDVSTTAYYVASEAVANAVKHSEADRIGLDVAQVDGRLTVRVTDNGRGGAALLPGSGLAGLRDRVAALGGSLAVHSPPGGATVVEAVLPCAS